jgi:hypothetical protein
LPMNLSGMTSKEKYGMFVTEWNKELLNCELRFLLLLLLLLDLRICKERQ